MRYLISFFLLISSLANGGENLNFENIFINEFAKIGYTQILDKDLIIDDAFGRETKSMSIFLKNRTKSEIFNYLNSSIESIGYDVLIDGRLVKITKHLDNKKIDLIPFFYRPKYREVGYLADLVANLFETGSFTFNRAVVSKQVKTSVAVDSGTSAYSLLQKPQDAFLFNGTKNEIERLTQLMHVLDIPQKEVSVKAYIYEFSQSDGQTQSLGVAVNLLNSKLNANLATDVLSSFINIKTFGINAVFSALESDGRFKVVSSPSLRIKDRETAKFSVGADVPILGAVTTQNGSSTQSIDYKQSGVIFEVTPKIRENVIELNINQELSNFVQTNNGVNNSPTLLKRGLSTVVTAQNDEVIILGGLDEEKASSRSNGFPWMPNFLRNKSREKTNSNILLVLHVQLI